MNKSTALDEPYRRTSLSILLATLIILTLQMFSGCVATKPSAKGTEAIASAALSLPQYEIAFIDSLSIKVVNSKNLETRTIITAEEWLYPLLEGDLSRRQPRQLISYLRTGKVYLALYDRNYCTLSSLDSFNLDYPRVDVNVFTCAWYDDSLLCVGYAPIGKGDKVKGQKIWIYNLNNGAKELLPGKSSFFVNSWITPSNLLISDLKFYYVVERPSGKIVKKYARDSYHATRIFPKSTSMAAISAKTRQMLLINLISGHTKTLFQADSEPAFESFNANSDWVCISFRDPKIRTCWARHLTFYFPAIDSMRYLPVPSIEYRSIPQRQVVGIHLTSGRLSPCGSGILYNKATITWFQGINLRPLQN